MESALAFPNGAAHAPPLGAEAVLGRGRSRGAGIFMLDITDARGQVQFRLKVVPGASRTRIVGPMDGALKVSVSAPPEKGRANKQVIALLAAALGVRANQVTIRSGRSSAFKLCAVSGVSAEKVRQALESASAGGAPAESHRNKTDGPK